MIRDEDIEAVKSAVNMVQLAEYYGMKVDRNGQTLCPFHDDRKPSLKLYRGYVTKDGYHCYSCGASGSIFNFVMEYENLTFEESVRRIASMFGIPVSDGDAKPTREDLSRNRTRILLRWVDERVRELNHQRMQELAERLKWYEQLRDAARPYSGLWCYLAGQIEVLRAEWEWRYNEIEGR